MLLRFTLYIYLITSKISVFQLITAYNMDFQITLNKLTNTSLTQSSDFQLAAYLHKIDDTYLDITVSKRSAIQTKILAILEVMAELKDKP